MKIVLVLIFLFLFCNHGFAAEPDCDGPDEWPAKITFIHLKNAGLTNNDNTDFSKTKSIRLASEKIGPDLYRQVHYVTYVQKSGKTIDSIAINNTSSEECSMSGVEVFVIHIMLGP